MHIHSQFIDKILMAKNNKETNFQVKKVETLNKKCYYDEKSCYVE